MSHLKWLITTRSGETENVLKAVIAHDLLKAEEATAQQVADLQSDDFTSRQSVRNQNSALNYDGLTPLRFDVGQRFVTVEPILE